MDLPLWGNERNMDIFANIAMARVQYREANLVTPEPPKLPEKVLRADTLDPAAVFQPAEKMDTPEKLSKVLSEYRAKYAPFLEDHAPAFAATRETRIIPEAGWRMETAEDRREMARALDGLGEWSRVALPHYGGPVGRHAAYYRMTFTLDSSWIDNRAVFIRFKGVDYKAQIFLNGNYIGSHEGFFAPFEFDCTHCARVGENILLARVENDFHDERGVKVYAATGLGWDDPKDGWHHCPPGMGIYQDVKVESRPRLHVRDIFVRPLVDEKRAEVWLEIQNCDACPREISLTVSVFGRNFTKTVLSGLTCIPSVRPAVGIPATLSAGRKMSGTVLGDEQRLKMQHGVNYVRVPLEMDEDLRLWTPETPWLYQARVSVLDETGATLDTANSQFGMRSFRQDVSGEPKGAFYLNGQFIRLRGANTMGHEQQCVFKRDWDQLIDDILLAKICNMNFLRLTQRPVQPEVYDYCDRLGLMTQTDLPLFGNIHITQFAEVVRQAGEMERLIRGHACNILVSYMNEPFPNANNKPHRFVTREQMEDCFTACDAAVRLMNPDRVIKAVDGDYDPPAPGLPDRHCYPGWYNGHGIALGLLHRGYWQPVRGGWYYACGEFGAEGLDPVSVMRKCYPEDWLPRTPEEEKDWTPSRILMAQTGNFYGCFFDRPDSLEEWVELSWRHQAWATSLMTEAFRRDNRMVSFAIHLFIDAFPSGWMKTIMDFERRPKQAFFAYREALTPLMANWRTDRRAYYAGETMRLEAWICNDRPEAPKGTELRYLLEMDGKTVLAGKTPADIKPSLSVYQGCVEFHLPAVERRVKAVARLALVDADGAPLHDHALALDVFPRPERAPRGKSYFVGAPCSKSISALEESGFSVERGGAFAPGCPIVVEDMEAFAPRAEEALEAVRQGSVLLLNELPPGAYAIAGKAFTVKTSASRGLHFVSRKTGHPLVEGFEPEDFKFWHDPEAGYVTPLLESTFEAEGFEPVLLGFNRNDAGVMDRALALGVLPYGRGRIAVNQVSLAGRVGVVPAARIMLERLLERR